MEFALVNGIGKLDSGSGTASGGENETDDVGEALKLEKFTASERGAGEKPGTAVSGAAVVSSSPGSLWAIDGN